MIVEQPIVRNHPQREGNQMWHAKKVESRRVTPPSVIQELNHNRKGADGGAITDGKRTKCDMQLSEVT